LGITKGPAVAGPFARRGAAAGLRTDRGADGVLTDMADDSVPQSRKARRQQAELVAFVDGRLDPRRAAAVEARMAASAQLRSEVAMQRRALAAVRSADVPAPERLRARVRDRRAATAGRRRARLGLAGGLAGVAAAAGVVAALSLSGPPPRAPTAGQAASLSLRGPSGPPPGPSRTRPGLLAASTGGVAYPYWEDRFGWRAVGARSDRLGRRLVNTVFYERGRQRVGYSIVAGRRLPPPSQGTDRVVGGVRLRSFTTGGQRAVTWIRDGRTCVLSGRGVDVETLLALAAERRGAPAR
jgi:anti-sigma factor RsiW